MVETLVKPPNISEFLFLVVEHTTWTISIVDELVQASVTNDAPFWAGFDNKSRVTLLAPVNQFWHKTTMRWTLTRLSNDGPRILPGCRTCVTCCLT
jgi:hypothetical protein